MLRKSIETRDWLNNVEPRSVRAVMKRVVEETTSIGKNHAENTLYEPHSCSSRQSTYHIFMENGYGCPWRSILKLLVIKNLLFSNLPNPIPPINQFKIQKIKFHPHENQAEIMGWYGWDSNLIITIVASTKGLGDQPLCILSLQSRMSMIKIEKKYDLVLKF